MTFDNDSLRWKVGDRAFSVAAPCICNCLPIDLKLVRLTASFKRNLKSFSSMLHIINCIDLMTVECTDRHSCSIGCTTSVFCYCLTLLLHGNQTDSVDSECMTDFCIKSRTGFTRLSRTNNYKTSLLLFTISHLL